MGRKLTNVIESQQFDFETLQEIFNLTRRVKESSANEKLLRGNIVAMLFYEESTRTRFSFEIATLRLGGQFIATENARHFSSAAKGESLEDTIRVLSGYPIDLIVLRYYEGGGAKRAQGVSRVPIVNAGDGQDQHPTQALLDLYTMIEYFGELKGKKIGFVGDLERGRTVRSLCYFLAKHYPENEIYLISPEEARMESEIKDYLTGKGVIWHETTELKPVLSHLDIVYQTRVQKERFGGNKPLLETVQSKSEQLYITEETLAEMKKDAIIMHPLPRNDEIQYAVDKDGRAKYFDQAKNGCYVRMALLRMILYGY